VCPDSSMMELSALIRFPCRPDKRPLRKAWQDTAIRAHAEEWPLVGVPTGAANGFDVLDIDPIGRGWYDANFDALPSTQAHDTPRGLHLLFRHVLGLRSRTSIVPGVDVRADGGFVIWWDGPSGCWNW
jgi:Bifunctional DNA primase/polymerase, N-terminal